MPIQRPNAVVDFFVPDFESPSYVKGRVAESSDPVIQVGSGVQARAGGLQRIVEIANGRKGHVFIDAFLTPNTNESTMSEVPWFASMVFDEASTAKPATAFTVNGPSGQVVALVGILDSDYSHVEANIQPNGDIHVLITPQ